jgi:hypothetical protein
MKKAVNAVQIQYATVLPVIDGDLLRRVRVPVGKGRQSEECKVKSQEHGFGRSSLFTLHSSLFP